MMMYIRKLCFFNRFKRIYLQITRFTEYNFIKESLLWEDQFRFWTGKKSTAVRTARVLRKLTCKKDFQPDHDQDRAAQYGGPAGKFCPEPFADGQPGDADEEGHGGNDQRAGKGHEKIVIHNGKAHRQRVYGGGDALNEQRVQADSVMRGFLLLVTDALQQHFSADKEKQRQCDPGDPFLKHFKILHHRVHTDPADHGHQRLKETEHTRDAAHLFPFHSWVAQPVGERYGKGVHRQSYAEQYAVKEKLLIPFHLLSLLNRKTQVQS